MMPGMWRFVAYVFVQKSTHHHRGRTQGSERFQRRNVRIRFETTIIREKGEEYVVEAVRHLCADVCVCVCVYVSTSATRSDTFCRGGKRKDVACESSLSSGEKE